LTRGRVIIQPFKKGRIPIGNVDPAHIGHTFQSFEIGLEHKSGDDRNINSGVTGPVEKTNECIGFKKELRNGTCSPCINFAFQIIYFNVPRRAFGMAFRIGTDRDFKIRDRLRVYNAFQCLVSDRPGGLRYDEFHCPNSL